MNTIDEEIRAHQQRLIQAFEQKETAEKTIRHATSTIEALRYAQAVQAKEAPDVE